MYHPTTRVLTILELLQTYHSLSSTELARRLEVGPRTVRRYIQMLQDMGIPIEAVRGPGGGYRLRPGFKLPPLMFTEEEATAVVLGLLGSAWLQIGQPAVAVEGAIAKVTRVLPAGARERLRAISAHLVLSSHSQERPPEATLLIDLSVAIQQCQRITIEYHSQHNEVTQRMVEPYGLAGWWGRWYLVGYCCLRQDYRLFRLDRIQQVQILAETFGRAHSFDPQVYAAEQLAPTASPVPIEVTFQAPLAVVQQKIPFSYGTLTPIPEGVLFQSRYYNVAMTARYLVGLNLPFVVHQPPELREALFALADQMIRSATNGSPSWDSDAASTIG